MAGLNAVPSGERVHIGFFGLRNVGKSSLVNAVTGQDLAVVSDVKGTTTDPVQKAMELLPIGPVVIIDTPGIDDAGGLGEMRVERARRVLRKCDIAVLVTEAGRDLLPAEEELVALFHTRGIPFVVAENKCDIAQCHPERGTETPSPCHPERSGEAAKSRDLFPHSIPVSALTGTNIHELKELIGRLAQDAEPEKHLVADLLSPGDTVVLVVPIDASAPKGRIILPQQMVLRDVLDAHASAMVCQPEELSGVLDACARPPRIVITDSQAFAQVARIVPEDLPLTSFSILMARYKGELTPFARGAQAIGTLEDGDRVLISEGCTHHRQCEDIGTVKMPAWIRAHCGANPVFDFTSGGEFPDDLSPYALVVHCGGCMLNAREMRYRMQLAEAAGVPIVNYGIAIAHMHGILDRSLQPFR
ncbi:MAG: [FeFe] hydrogenase H-cluster maturation GTPase HydF [Coriobacteriia bacterium]|nr:[FeFe] hydrogenase H-cluster maturation GTPase HydF [Coriobacteriia bacterium]